MKMNLISENPFPESAELEETRAENEILAQQVKRLIRAEGKLYAYQEQLDAQLREYKDLYELNRKLNATFDLREIFAHTIEYIIHNLEYERVILLEEAETMGQFTVTALDGYYEGQEKGNVESIVVQGDDPFMTPLYRGVEY
ncbi:MAG TPA: PAS domain-containing sensor histidine kinase, partial [Geobacteraceae bacterium]